MDNTAWNCPRAEGGCGQQVGEVEQIEIGGQCLPTFKPANHLQSRLVGRVMLVTCSCGCLVKWGSPPTNGWLINQVISRLASNHAN